MFERPRRRGLPVLATLAALVALAAASPLSAQDVGIEIGATPAAVTIEDLDGNPVELARWVGKKPVVFQFWATWCPLCEALEPRVAAAKQRFGDQVEVVFIAVAVNQSQRSIQRHLRDHALPGPILWDTGGRATRAYKAPTTSYIVVLDAAGRVAYTGVGEDQDIVAAVARTLN
jgi:thiol-disulfide isomerase/thioredoxin